jgi:hypothetical protein
MAAKTNTEETRTDFIGQEIKIGQRCITYYTAGFAGLGWGTVESFAPKMVRININGKKDRRYPKDIVVLNEDQEGQLILKMIGGS